MIYTPHLLQFAALALSVTGSPEAAPQQHVGVTRAQLACEPLPSHPFAQYPRAFHEGRPVHVAVDPSRFPELIGQTLPLFIVPAQSQRSWRADARLRDVRGAPQAIRISAGSIADNVFEVDAGTLDGDAGDDLGVGYDIVIDVNASGALDWGDIIDGWIEPGFFVVRDTTQPGPYAVTEALYSGGSFLGQNTFWPTNIDALGQVPLVVVSHGNGHDYKWYGHIGQHLASWGYVVMSHENNTQPGVGQAARTTIDNTDYLIDNLDVLAGGVLDGHVDTNSIVWIGHSRGGEGVVRAYQRAVTGTYTPKYFVPDDIKLLVSMAPVTFLAGKLSTPDEVPYWLIYGGADSDVTGGPGVLSAQPFAIYERAAGPKHSTYIQGVGHAWLHDKTGNCFCTGPSLLNRKITHQILLGYLVPLLELHLEDSLAARDFFERSYADFHPAGIDPSAIVASEHRDAVSAGNFVIDDFQTNPAIDQSSSDGLVTTNASNVFEGWMADENSTFTHAANLPMNGMTRSSDASFDLEQCLMLDWAPGTAAYLEFELAASERDLTDDRSLSFRACQQTRHPHTDQLDASLSFTITLRDGAGVESSLSAANYGDVTRTYRRNQSGVGAGWANEFNTFRLRLRDFTLDGSALDLTDITAVRFEFGSGFGSEPGRIGLDDIQITRD